LDFSIQIFLQQQKKESNPMGRLLTFNDALTLHNTIPWDMNAENAET